MMHLLSSVEWDFFYCFKCRNWFELAEGNHEISYLVEDKNKVLALNTYYMQYLQEVEALEEGPKFVRSVLRKISNSIDRLISPYMVED